MTLHPKKDANPVAHHPVVVSVESESACFISSMPAKPSLAYILYVKRDMPMRTIFEGRAPEQRGP
jgi:hypothetical protein